MLEFGGPYTLGTGQATASFYAGVTVKTVCGLFRLSFELFSALHKAAKTRREDPVPALFLERYGERIRIVWETLAVNGYERSTVVTYSRIMGELMNWLDTHGPGSVTHAKLGAFFDHLVQKARTNAELHFGAREDPDGLALRYVAFHAVRTVLDRCFEMGVTTGLVRPCRPKKLAPTALDTAGKLYVAARDDRERLLLILFNGLSLMPYQVASLRWNAFDSSFGSVTVSYGKNADKRMKTVQIVNGYQKAIRDCYRRAHRRGDPTQTRSKPDYVFPSKRKGGRKPTTVRTLENVLLRLSERCGIREQVTPTSLRKGGAYMPSATEWGNPDVTTCADDRRSMQGASGRAASVSFRTVPAARKPEEGSVITTQPVSAAAQSSGQLQSHSAVRKPIAKTKRRPSDHDIAASDVHNQSGDGALQPPLSNPDWG